MFTCWFEAFEDFLPGLKAEWKGAFANKVINNPSKKQNPELVRRASSSNGNWDHLAVNRIRSGSGLRGGSNVSRLPSTIEEGKSVG
jgi:hypothetical protein